MSSSLSSFDIIMEFSSSLFSEEVLSLSSHYLNNEWLEAFLVGLELSNTNNEADIILEPYVPEEKVCMRWPQEVPNK